MKEFHANTKQLISERFNCFHSCVIAVATIILTAALNSCSPLSAIKRSYRNMSASEKAVADSIMAYALDHEALYSLQDTLKPMSSIKMYRLPLLSSHKPQADSGFYALAALQKTVNLLNSGDWQFILNPFERPDSIYKNIELYVVRKSKMASVIAKHQAFYSRLGISPSTNPATVVAITEYENKYDRWRSYGYLFGYPDYAVDFFVTAGKEQDSTKQFVKRDFIHIPVYTGTSGYFTYAVPKGYQPGNTDSIIYRKALQTLDEYKLLRKKYSNTKGLKAIKLFTKQK